MYACMYKYVRTSTEFKHESFNRGTPDTYAEKNSVRMASLIGSKLAKLC